MAFSETNGWLPDVNVWLALCSDRHEHHGKATDWLEAVRTPVYFCRVTQMALLRLLTNPKVMETDILTPQNAIGVYKELGPMKECDLRTNRLILKISGCR
jgi:predicted nucleic acid-binding protein